jgi:hypothetical protein
LTEGVLVVNINGWSRREVNTGTFARYWRILVVVVLVVNVYGWSWREATFARHILVAVTVVLVVNIHEWRWRVGWTTTL